MNHNRESKILQKVMSEKFLTAMNANGGFVAGGAMRSLFASEPIKDIDIFFPSRVEFDHCIKSMGGEDSPSFTQTDTAWTHNDGSMTYQLICASYGTPEEVIKRFDFTCCMAAWRHDVGFVMDDLFLKHTSQRRLCFNINAEFPLCSLWRAMKFVKRGWRLPGIEAIKLGLKLNHIDIKDRKELKRQLMGLDTIFLKELTDALGTDASAAYDFGEAIAFVMNFADNEE